MNEFKFNSTLSKKIPTIIKLVRKGFSKKQILNKCSITNASLNKVIKAYSIEIPDKRKLFGLKRVDRNKAILELLSSDKYTYTDIGNMYGLSNQRIQQIALRNGGIRRHTVNRERREEIVGQIMNDSLNLTYNEIKQKYDIFERFPWVAIKIKFKQMYGIRLYEKFMSNRNQTILNEYSSGKIAREVIEGYEHELQSPEQIKTAGSVYNISKKLGYKKFPKVYNRAAGGLFEDKKVLDLIVKLRDVKKMTFNEIAKKLNDTGYKTVTDIDFNGPNLIVKYHNYKTRGKKIYDIKNKNKNKI